MPGGQHTDQNPSQADAQSLSPHFQLTQMAEGEVQVLDEYVDRAFGDPDDFLVPWTVELGVTHSAHPPHLPTSFIPGPR